MCQFLEHILFLTEYNEDFETALKKDTSGDFQHLLIALSTVIIYCDLYDFVAINWKFKVFRLIFNW